MTGRKYKTDIVSLETLNNFSFYIPTYQRPYVWGDEQLKKLLDDFYQSFKNAPYKPYFISTFLTREDGNKSELIDGQQRFTSLWLISFVLSEMCPKSRLSEFLKFNEQLRLGFEIRKEVEEFMNSLMEEENSAKRIYDEEYIEKHPYLRNIAKAFVFIRGYFNQLPKKELEDFGNYIYTKICFIKNSTPKNTDLNKLFSTINSAGVQLEQTDIVKANLLSLIDDKVAYSKIWEACENMNNFFERNLRESFSSSNWSDINLNEFVPFNKEVFLYKIEDTEANSKHSVFSIDELDIQTIKAHYTSTTNKSEKDERESSTIYCRSIISFAQLLLHTYRLHLYKEGKEDFEGTFHVSRLIEIFQNLQKRNDELEIKRFFRLLWDVRYMFDKYIVKWISDIDAKTETLEIVNFNRNEDSYYSRSNYEKSNSLMLQSVLYFTGDYLRQYWLTSYLGYLLNNHKNLLASSNEHLEYLETIDNYFSLNTSLTDKELSRSLLEKKYVPEKNIDITSYLNSYEGTRFKHYWFQKLEYLLWKNWPFEKTEEYKNYRITSKNSVEHIYPQNPENKIQHPDIADSILHSFGNLVLLSVSQNSEYSNKSVNVKRSMFLEKKEAYDALKSFYIFQHQKWGTPEILEHRSQMIKIIINHYGTTANDDQNNSMFV